MDGHGQPALLYIVPFTLGKFFFTERVENNLKKQNGLVFT
jgi:hypothetical protein